MTKGGTCPCHHDPRGLTLLADTDSATRARRRTRRAPICVASRRPSASGSALGAAHGLLAEFGGERLTIKPHEPSACADQREANVRSSWSRLLLEQIKANVALALRATQFASSCSSLQLQLRWLPAGAVAGLAPTGKRRLATANTHSSYWSQLLILIRP